MKKYIFLSLAVLILVLGYIFRPIRDNAWFVAAYLPAPLSANEPNEESSLYEKGLWMYKQKEYSELIQRMDSLPVEAAEYCAARALMAKAYLHLHKEDSAIVVLTPVLKDATTSVLVRGDVACTLALAHILRNEDQQAKEVLEPFTDQSDKARNMKEALESLWRKLS